MNKRLVSTSKYGYIFLFVVSILISSRPAAASLKTVVFDLKGINISEKEASVITLNFRKALSDTHKYNVYSPSESGIPDSISIKLVNSYNKETAYKLATLMDAAVIIWGNIGKVDDRYIITVMKVSKSENAMAFDSYQEEIEGKLSDVLEYSINNIVKKLTGEIDSDEITQTSDAGKDTESINEIDENITTGKGSGWLEIKGVSEDVKIYIDGEYLGNGECKAKLPAGVHRVTAKSDEDTKTELIEIFTDNVSTVAMDIDNTRRVRFTASFEGSFMLGSSKEFGPCHSLGLMVLDKHFFGLNYYWGLPAFEYSYIFGGGLIYMYTVNYKNIVLSQFGVTIGFWHEDPSGYFRYSLYVGGPKIRFQVGYKHVFFINEATLLLGTDSPKILLNPGISFIF